MLLLASVISIIIIIFFEWFWHSFDLLLLNNGVAY